MTVEYMHEVAEVILRAMKEFDAATIFHAHDLRLLILKLQMLGLRPKNIEGSDGVEAVTAIAQTIFSQHKSRSRIRLRTKMRPTPLITAEWLFIFSLAEKLMRKPSYEA